MKYVEVHPEDLNVGDIVWDCNPNNLIATKFSVVGIENDILLLKHIYGDHNYEICVNGYYGFPLHGLPFYREEGAL